jgi:hypothetical protein
MPSKLHLFSVTHGLLKTAVALCICGALVLAMALVAIPVIASNLDADHFGIPAVIEGSARADVLAFAAFVLASALISVLLILFALHATTQIVRAAMTGDPFVSENAKRLARIGRLLLAVQLVGLVTLWVYQAVPERLGHVSLLFGPSPSGLIAILMIFVLARIFRHGSEMRAELEGTI